METLGYRTSSTAFSQRRKTSSNNHIKIRTLCYSQGKSTEDTERPQTVTDAGERPNLSTTYIWLRKPVGIPTSTTNKSPKGTPFGYRTFHSSTKR
jgi:16S rRNA U516 pseudouridylate synthase RsuA-like enzyme